MQTALPSQPGLAHSAKSLQETIAGKVALVVLASLLVAACAHVSLPLPFTPVPITLQTFSVILVGMLLGPISGFSALMLYLAEGAAGMPVFSPHEPAGITHLLGASGGFLFSYPLAAAIAGWTIRGTSFLRSRFARGVVAGFAASVVVFTLGAGWLAHFAHVSSSLAWHLAVAPFVPGDVVKITAAAGIFSSLERWTRS